MKRAKLPRNVFFNDSEMVAHRRVAEWLDFKRVLWCHVPNGEWRAISTARRLKKLGVKPGVPDILVFTPPPLFPEACGAALEMKRLKGNKVSAVQSDWLLALAECGWRVCVAHGDAEAIDWLTKLGY